MGWLFGIFVLVVCVFINYNKRHRKIDRLELYKEVIKIHTKTCRVCNTDGVTKQEVWDNVTEQTYKYTVCRETGNIVSFEWYDI